MANLLDRLRAAQQPIQHAGRGLAERVTGQERTPLQLSGNRAVGGVGGPVGTDVFAGEESFSDILSQFLDPTLTDKQAGIQRAFAGGAAARGLQGGAVQSQLEQQSTAFRAGNRAEALQQLTGAVENRLRSFRQTVNPLFEFVGRQAFGGGNTRELLETDLSDAVFSGFRSLGLGGFNRAFLARELGRSPGQGGRAFAGTEENQQAFAALQQFLNPRLSGAQQRAATQFGRQSRTFRRIGDRGARQRTILGKAQQFQNAALAANKLFAGAELTNFFGQQLGQLNQQLTQLQGLGGGFGSALGQGAAGAQKILNQDVSQFSGLFNTLGLGREQRQFDQLDPQRVGSFFQGADRLAENRFSVTPRIRFSRRVRTV